MDNDGNKVTWVVIILACVLLIGVFVVNTLFPTQIKNIETYIDTVFVKTTNIDTLDSLSTTSKDGFTYSINTDGAKTMSITNYDPTGIMGTDVNIPTNVNYKGTIYTVTTIGYKAFANSGLTSVVIPNSIITIADGAFYNNDLKSIIIPNSVQSIGINAFCINFLTNITIPNSVIRIDAGAFASNKLTSVIIPESITILSNYVFQHNKLTFIAIPASVTTIGVGTFASNNLTSATVPAGLQSQIESNDVFSDNASTLSITYN